MTREELDLYVCPASRTRLALEGDVLRSENGARYPMRDGVPDLTYPPELAIADATTRAFYDGRPAAYDANLHLTFETHGEDELKLRNEFVDALRLQPDDRVLEIACGTGRDSEVLAGRLSRAGRLCLTDISSGMLAACRKRLANMAVPTAFALANACHLPYPDRSFDAVYSFGGLGEFSNIRGALAEMVRVSKVGARIVVGDESMPPWLRHTEFAKILTMTNHQFSAKVPLDEIPVDAREVCLRWVIGGVFYLISFSVGEGEPTGRFDLEIPGPRGGTLRTRFSGQLEGVTPETKRLAERACQTRGASMHRWLDDAVRKAALKDLDDRPDDVE